MIIKIILTVSILFINIGESYFKGPVKTNFDNAASYCQSQFTTLATVLTQNEWNQANSDCGSTNCWIGLKYDTEWSWQDNTEIGSNYGFNDGIPTNGQGPWRPETNEPNNAGGDEGCVHMYRSGLWNDRPCSDSNRFPLCNDVPSLSCGGSVTGDIVPREREYYRVDLDITYQEIFVEACNPATNFDTYLSFYNEIGQVINACDDCQNHGEQCANPSVAYPQFIGDLTINNIDAGTYYVGIGGYAFESGNYELTLTCNNGPSAKTVHEEISYPEDNNYYQKYSKNNEDNNYNHDIHTIEISSNLLLIICGLMVVNIICLAIYCMDNNKKEKGYKVVKYESEDSQLV